MKVKDQITARLITDLIDLTAQLTSIKGGQLYDNLEGAKVSKLSQIRKAIFIIKDSLPRPEIKS